MRGTLTRLRTVMMLLVPLQLSVVGAGGASPAAGTRSVYAEDTAAVIAAAVGARGARTLGNGDGAVDTTAAVGGGDVTPAS